MSSPRVDRVEVPVLPAAGLSAARGGALALGAAGLPSDTTAGGLTAVVVDTWLVRLAP